MAAAHDTQAPLGQSARAPVPLLPGKALYAPCVGRGFDSCCHLLLRSEKDAVAAPARRPADDHVPPGLPASGSALELPPTQAADKQWHCSAILLAFVHCHDCLLLQKLTTCVGRLVKFDVQAYLLSLLSTLYCICGPDTHFVRLVCYTK
eukprot:SM000155S01684  [mRNA]  locus=s155:208509:209292:+ [translate_table: standard]